MKKAFPILLPLILCLAGCADDHAFREVVTLNDKIDNNLSNASVREVLLPEDTMKLYPHRTVYFQTGRSFQPINLRAGDVSWDRKKFRIGLMDLNSNGIYNEVGIDKMVLCPNGVGGMILSSSGSKFDGYLRYRTFFKVDRDRYELIEIDPGGEQLTIQKVPDHTVVSAAASFYTFLPNILVEDTTGVRIPLRSCRPENESLEIFIWSLGPHQGAIIKELNERYVKEGPFNIVGINMLDTKERVKTFVRNNNIKIPCYFAIEDTCEELGCFAALPFALRIDDRGRIVEHGIRRGDFGWNRITTEARARSDQ